MYIACPRCDWQPTADHKWSCTCGNRWNTFETHGVCPKCGKIWKVTQCPVRGGCGQWSDHEEWYHDDNDILVVDYLENPYVVSMPTEQPKSSPS